MNFLKRAPHWILLGFLLSGFAAAELKVASLHPLMTDLSKQVGGKQVTVVQLIGAHADPHHFNPTPKMLAKAKGSQLFIASGKGLESYLDKLRQTVGPNVKVIEVGKTVPSQQISARDSLYVCCPTHAHGAIDPHWWHRVSNMKKAARVLAKEFAKVDPANAAIYKTNAATYSRRLDQLNDWIKREISRIPKQNRILATAHAAFGYYCKEYGLKSLPIKGLTASHKTSASYQAEAISQIRKNRIRAVFPEKRANPKALSVIAKETGVKVGGTLIADGDASYERMMQVNTKLIVQALAR